MNTAVGSIAVGSIRTSALTTAGFVGTGCYIPSSEWHKPYEPILTDCYILLNDNDFSRTLSVRLEKTGESFNLMELIETYKNTKKKTITSVLRDVKETFIPDDVINIVNDYMISSNRPA